ncbi:hypothetical protein H310_10608 [Aphanomyces invadans]|uniref:Uncharacterized protein n=1 Tax=Aphanomyces invadans TaxID=157072 RepID=A0A024TPL5_9STRA|nr:hypothetical protein H310_10608 [Aphanomyces invadans]ETV95948.1 hypothetical protein H310_10608 [Aphanomyces invadans]|eukprot:XP_008875259.1 hypothetical protein H310_10608 [Aphanomyces invadans]
MKTASTSPARRSLAAAIGDVSPPRTKKEAECPGAPKKKKRTKVRTFPRLILNADNEAGGGIIANPAAVRSLEDELRVAAPPDEVVPSKGIADSPAPSGLMAFVAISSTSPVRSPIATRSKTSLATRLSTPSHLRSPATPNLRRVAHTMTHNAPSPDTTRHVVPRPAIAPLPMGDLNVCKDPSEEGDSSINPIPSRAMYFGIPPPLFLH